MGNDEKIPVEMDSTSPNHNNNCNNCKMAAATTTATVATIRTADPRQRAGTTHRCAHVRHHYKP
jgi:hypothetical protein